MSLKNSKIAVIGSGAWGTAIANLIAINSYQVALISNNKIICNEIVAKKTNQKYLPQIKLNKNLKALFEVSYENLKDVDFIFIVTPSQVVAEILHKIASFKIKKKQQFIICSKGIDAKSLKFFSEIFSDIFPKNKCVILSGPNFAIEVAQAIPTITTIASADKNLAKKIITILQNQNFRADYCDDVITTEICAVMKNIMAIGCGIIDGLELGQNAKAALVKQGIDEILLLCQKLKSKSKLANAAGFGDIFLTCSTTKSRNNSLGFAIAQGKSLEEISLSANKTFEGVFAVKSIVKLAKKKKIKLKLCQTIDAILANNFSVKEIKEKISKAIL